MTQDEAQEAVEKRKGELEAEVAEASRRMDSLRSQMSDLKTHLYAKFGSAINLEADDDQQ